MKKLPTFTRLWLQVFLGVIFSFQSLTAQGVLTVDLGSDTLFVCAGEAFTLNPTVSGGVAPYQFSWSDSSTLQTYDATAADGDSLLIWVEVLDGQNAVVRDSVWVFAFGNCIWPGDMNGDGVANHVDMLEWGRAVGSVGPMRPQAHTNWMGQASPSWGLQLPGGHDYAYADTDGDGIIHLDDLQAIGKNYTRVTPMLASGNGNGPVLTFEFPSDSSVVVGDTIRIPVFLGSANAIADSIYGLAVSIEYDNAIINSGSVRVDFDSSWLGNPAVDLVGMNRDFHQAGQLDIAVTRIDQQARSGQGRLFDIIVTIDNVAGKNNSVFTLFIDALDVRLMLGNGQQIPLTTRSLSLDILPERLPRGPEPTRSGVKASPNPASSILILNPGDQGLREVQLIDQLGKLVYKEEKEREDPFTWQLAGFDKGMYLLRMKTIAGEWITQKIQIID